MVVARIQIFAKAPFPSLEALRLASRMDFHEFQPLQPEHHFHWHKGLMNLHQIRK